jgi:hypothetical protein
MPQTRLGISVLMLSVSMAEPVQELTDMTLNFQGAFNLVFTVGIDYALHESSIRF